MESTDATSKITNPRNPRNAGRRKELIAPETIADVLFEAQNLRSVRQIAIKTKLTEFYVRRIIREYGTPLMHRVFKCDDYSARLRL